MEAVVPKLVMLLQIRTIYPSVSSGDVFIFRNMQIFWVLCKILCFLLLFQ